MSARTGKQYLAGLREQEREVWLEGERVKDPTTHPGLKGGSRAIAALYDMQNDPELRDEMTYVSPTTGDRVGLSFIVPRTREDLENRRVMMLKWARTTCGMMGRSPDFMNVTYAAWAGADPPAPRATQQRAAPSRTGMAGQQCRSVRRSWHRAARKGRRRSSRQRRQRQ